MKSILKLILAWVVILLTAVSCSNDSFWDIDEPLKEGEAQVILRLKAPGGYSVPKTRSMTHEDENRIETIDVLIFDKNNKLLMIKQGEEVSSSSSSSDPQYSGTGSFSVTLESSATADDKYNLVVLANARAIMVSRGTHSLIGSHYNDVVLPLWDEIAGAMYVSGGTIPMSGETGQMVIEAGATNQALSLTRSIARIDVGVGIPSYDPDTHQYQWTGKDENDRPIEFELTHVYVIKPNDRYAVVSTSLVGAPIVPTGTSSFSLAESELLFKFPTERLSTQRSIYVPESDVFMSANGKPGDTNHTNRMAIVVAGKYKGSATESYYRLDFSKSKTLMNVLRNHLYQFNISSVSGDGFKDVETAYNSLAMNMTVDILEWNEADMGDINFDGTYYFSVSDRKVEFTPFGGEIETVTIKTNAEDFEMWDTDLNGSTFQMKASTTQLTYGPLANGYKYTLARTGSTDIYTLTIECQKSNVSSLRPDRNAHWKFVANRISVPFEVNQQWTSFYISVVNGQSTRLFPEGTEADLIPIDIMASKPVLITTGGASWVTLSGDGGLSTADGEGHYRGRVRISVPAFRYGVGFDGLLNRTATITITSEGEEPVVYTVMQEAPFLRLSSSIEQIARPAAPAVITRDIDVLTNVRPEDLTLVRRSETATHGARIQAGAFESIDAVRPRYVQFRVNADLTDASGVLPSSGFRVLFAVVPTLNKYGTLSDKGVSVDVPSAGTIFAPYWYKIPYTPTDYFFTPRYTQAIGGTLSNNNLIFPWNAKEVQFDLASNAGCAKFELDSDLNGGTLTSSASFQAAVNGSEETVYPWTFAFKNNFNTSKEYKLAFQATDYGRTDKATFYFRQGKQYWSRTGGSELLVKYNGVTEASPLSVTITNNVNWSCYSTGSLFMFMMGVNSGSFRPYPITTPLVQDDRLTEPARVGVVYNPALHLTKSSTLKFSFGSAGSPIQQSSTNIFINESEIIFTNNSHDATDLGVDLSSQKLTLKQYAPRIWFVSNTGTQLTHWTTSSPTVTSGKIPGLGSTFTVTANTNLLNWGVKVYEGTDNSGTAILTSSTVSAGNQGIGVNQTSQSFAVSSTNVERRLSFYFYSNDVPQNQIKFAEVVQASNSYSVNYDANGGSGAPTPSAKPFGTYITLSPTIPTYNERTFKGWSLLSNATVATWAAGASGVTDAALGNPSGSALSVTLYAVWEWNLIKEPGDAAPRIYLENNRLMLTQSPTNLGAYFQFGSVVAFSNTSTSIFNPSSVSGSWSNSWTGDAIHTVANLRDGKGDPCRLVGYTLQFIKDELVANRAPDNKLWRLPEVFSGSSSHSSTDMYNRNYRFSVVSGVNGCTFQDSPDGKFLPAAGYIFNNAFHSFGVEGHYWTSSVSSVSRCMTFSLTQFDVAPNNQRFPQYGLSVRCVRQ